MTELSRAEIDRRATEWLRVESSDHSFNSAFEAAKNGADSLQTLIAVGEWKRAHALLNGPVYTPARFENIVEEFVFGMLGYQPDAEKGRLQLRPKFPSAWSFAHVENIRVGDALVSLRFERAESYLKYELEQVSGSMPVRLIFAPVVSMPFAKVLVDGVEAHLNISSVSGDVVAPVQIMLDARRVVEFQ